MENSCYQQTEQELLQNLGTSRAGLGAPDAAVRLARDGANELQAAAPLNPLRLFLDQFKNFIIYILLFAVLFSLLIGEYADSILILIILLANALIGFAQELSANRSLEALKRISALQAVVIRDGRRHRIAASDLVVGDVIVVEAGDKVPADARLIEAVRLKIEEASLTGESVPVEKHSAPLPGAAQIGDQHNMLFASTAVVTGNGLAVVTAIGMATEIGKITSLIVAAGEEMTPLQIRLHRFGQRLGMVIIAVCVLVFALLTTQAVLGPGLSEELFFSFLLIGVSLAVAAVPTALPAVVTIALSIGVKRLLAKKALVRRLRSVETLGSCDVICTDKTGTLTENQMTVRYAWTLDGETELHGSGYAPEGEVSGHVDPLVFRVGLLCNNAALEEEAGGWQVIGDPTEGALLVSAIKSGQEVKAGRIDELPFDSERKLMSVLVREDDGSLVMYTKGAPDQLLACCVDALSDNGTISLTSEIREEIGRCNERYGAQALRVLGFARKVLTGPEDFVEQGLVFVGLQAMIDPPRRDVLESIKKTQAAGIRVIMATGDYQATAVAIGQEIGITGKACSGEQLEAMDDQQLVDLLGDDTNIFARVVPEHKQRIISALQEMGHVVAMTGDGVNDAPALKKANIGIAVGSGTEVAKEASDFVLLDDSFTHIVNAIEEGRGIYDNIQKSIMLLLSGNLGEVLIIFTAVLLGLNLPLTAILLLWINMITDGAPALAFSVDPYGRDIMLRKPKAASESILPPAKLMLLGALGVAGTVVALTLFVLYGGRGNGQELIIAQTMVFNFVVLYETVLIFAIRREYQVPLFTNRWIWLAAIFSITLQFVLMYTPLRSIFKIASLSSAHLLALVLAALFFYVLTRLYGLFRHTDSKNESPLSSP
ncbi:MAG: cation-translocating P-type ATPase [Desulfobulbaceae bacterium]|uniref:Cation-translocating P-type ATPase n=1 Tax=Candidatus Desulfatifera sulfidica TaxID=2841691 RepID=A0A8J6TD58_9BACT|nr:cation-translocating P-type ATPase [Candidatus Desulfatifera sulfidica]